MDFWGAVQSLLEDAQIVIDRPRGSVHPRFPEEVYPLDYGYLSETTAGDGEGIDVWVGTAGPEVTGVVMTVDLLKGDAELKVLLGCSRDEMDRIEQFHCDGGQSALLVRRGE